MHVWQFEEHEVQVAGAGPSRADPLGQVEQSEADGPEQVAHETSQEYPTQAFGATPDNTLPLEQVKHWFGFGPEQVEQVGSQPETTHGLGADPPSRTLPEGHEVQALGEVPEQVAQLLSQGRQELGAVPDRTKP